MGGNLAVSVLSRQEKNSPTANGPAGDHGQDVPMPKKRTRKPLIERKLYLGEWLSRLGVKQVTLADNVGISPQYVNELISGAKDNPSNALILDIAHFLEIPSDALFRLPPGLAAAAAVEGLSQKTLARLRRPDIE